MKTVTTHSLQTKKSSSGPKYYVGENHGGLASFIYIVISEEPPFELHPQPESLDGLAMCQPDYLVTAIFMSGTVMNFKYTLIVSGFYNIFYVGPRRTKTRLQVDGQLDRMFARNKLTGDL